MLDPALGTGRDAAVIPDSVAAALRAKLIR
jgi:hypothetical protein